MIDKSKTITVGDSIKPIFERSNTLVRYFKDIDKFKLLGHEETIELFKQYVKSVGKEKQSIRDRIFNMNARIVISLAKKYCSAKDNLMDLIEEGNIGLLNAIEKFDPEKGATFISFAMFHIRREINNFRMEMTPIVKRTNRSKTSLTLSPIISRLTQKLERVPTEQEIMDEYNRTYADKPIADKDDIVNVEYVYIDNFQAEEPKDTSSYNEYNSTTSSINSYLKSIDSEHNEEVLQTLMSGLSAIQRTVVTKHLGLKGTIEQGFYTIAMELGYTYERVRQIYTEAIRKLSEKSKIMSKQHVSNY
jgi:RNA polymerase sigma factor (sigma-70 family)